MANQITIDIGAAANDGTGDPLRTAFNYVNNNFSNVWNTGLPNSNVQFSDNRILTVNTNANLVLAPNGIGKVASNVDIVPNTANVFSIGGSDRRWNTVYGQYLNLSHNATIGGNLVVTGNITGGNIHYTGNVFVGDLEGSVFDGASSLVLDVINSSIYVDNYYYANGTPVSFGGNYGNANVAAYLPTYTGNISAGNAAITNLTSSNLVNGRTGTFTGDQFSDGAMYVGSPAGTVLGSDVVIQITANAGGYSQTNFQNINSGASASSDYILTADNGNDTTHYLDMGITSSGWDGSETNVLAGLVANNGYLYVQDGNLTLGTRNGNTSYGWNFDTTGNITFPDSTVQTTAWTGSSRKIINGTSQIDIPDVNGNIVVGVNNVGSTEFTALGINTLDLMALGNVTADGTVQGNVVTADSAINTAGTIGATGNITGGNIISDGEIISNGRAYVQYVDIRGGYSSGTIGSIGYGGNIVELQGTAGVKIVTTGDEGGPAWQFGTDGRLTVPDGAFIQVVDTNYLDIAYVGNIQIENEGGAWTFGADGVLTTPGDITGPGSLEIQAAPNGNAYVNLDDISDSYIGAAANLYLLANSDNREWIFDTTGTLTTPGDITVGGDVTGRASANTLVLKAQPTTDTYIQLNSIVDSTISIAANLDIVTDSSNTAQTFAFSADGNLFVPGNISANISGYEIGYRNIPQIVFPGDIQVSPDDSGKHYYNGTNTDYTVSLIDSGAVTYPVGTAVTIVNRGTGNIAVEAYPGVSLYMAGSSTAGNRTVGAYGMATVLNVATDIWMINGAGVY